MTTHRTAATAPGDHRPTHTHRYFTFRDANGAQVIVLAIVDREGMIFRAAPVNAGYVAPGLFGGNPSVGRRDLWVADGLPA